MRKFFVQMCFLMGASVAFGDEMSSNDVTLQSYERAISEYISGTPHEVYGSVKSWIDATLKLLPEHARIIEIGSAFGRDANYIESHGFTVERTDATEGFISLLQAMGHTVRRFNVLKDEFAAHYDLVFANAVFLHFTQEEIATVLGKVHAGLNERGILAFSVKKGEGEGWSTVKIG